MQIDDKVAVGLFSAIIGWLIAIFAQGRRIGRVESKAEARLETVENKIKESEGEAKTLRDHHDDDMRQIRAFFTDSAGGQKFVTWPGHDQACERNNKLNLQAVSHLTEALQENTAKVANMSEQIHQLKVTVAVLSERRHEGQRQDTNHETTILR